MATVTGLTAARMIEMEAATIIDGDVVGNNLILTTRGGTQINAGNVQGPIGPAGTGMNVCTSSTRPSHALGKQIIESDTGKVYMSDGTTWIYLEGPGDMRPWMTTVVPSGWLLCFGQSLLRSAYPLLFATLGTQFGTADGTHFNVPDLRGRQLTGLDNMGGTDAGRLSALNTLGAVGGEEAHILTLAELAQHTHLQNSHAHTENSHNHSQSPHAHNAFDGGHFHNGQTGGGLIQQDPTSTLASAEIPGGGGGYNVSSSGIGIASVTVDAQNANISAATATMQAATATNQNAGSGSPHNIMDPYMLVNWIVRAY